MYVQTIHRKGNPMNNTPHARAFDLPGWLCPPRVRDIPNHEDSWGWVPCQVSANGIYQDELGYLWADGNMVPTFRTLNGNSECPGAILAWTEQGLGVYVHPKSLRYIGSISKLDMEPDRWIPIAAVLAEPPKDAQA
jgi:hypothetical protein